jgi:hypothetical protein
MLSSLSHTHSQLVTQGQLDALPAPVSRGPIHAPIPHGVLVDAMKARARAEGYEVSRQLCAISGHGRRLFGVLDLVAPTQGREDRGFSIGFRNSTDTTLGIRMVAGVRVFVCDNLALSGDLIALQRRNTSRLDLEDALKEGFARFLTHAGTLDTQIEAMKTTPLADGEAKARAYDIFARHVLPLRLFTAVEDYYFHPVKGMEDCRPRTLWSLHNACTRAMKTLTPTRAFAANIALGQAFGLHQPTAA